jgi:hypothetical protein
MNYRCLVCGYDQMPHPPKDYNICPCCGVEYGLDDAFDSHRKLRNEWLKRGAPWFSLLPPYVAPVNWSAWDQVIRAGYQVDVPPPQSSVKTDIVRTSYDSYQLCGPSEDCLRGVAA